MLPDYPSLKKQTYEHTDRLHSTDIASRARELSRSHTVTGSAGRLPLYGAVSVRCARG